MDDVLPRSCGFDGGDGANKTRFALTTCRLLRAFDQRVLYCPFPNPRSITGGLIDSSHRYDPRIASEAMTALFAANRMETLPLLRSWLSRGEDHWIVMDRTKFSGEVYARAGGSEHVDWIRALDYHFPDVELGFYLTRPLEEAMEIARRRGPLKNLKGELDRNRELQIGVRKCFSDMVEGRENWHIVDVSGIADTYVQFRQWEKKIVEKIWNIVCTETGRRKWAERIVGKNEILLGEFAETEAIQCGEMQIYYRLWQEHSNSNHPERK